MSKRSCFTIISLNDEQEQRIRMLKQRGLGSHRNLRS